MLAVIPAMLTADERRKQKRRRLITVTASVATVVLVVGAVVAWRLEYLLNWVR